MGACQSSQIATYLEQSTADQLLEDEQFLSLVKVAVSNLSQRSQENLSALIPRKASNQAVNPIYLPKLKPVFLLQHSDVALPDAIRELFVALRSDWTLLFNEDGISKVPLLRKDISQPLSTAYSIVLSLQKQRVIDRIRWRFYTMFFFDLYWLKNQQNYFTPSGCRKIVDAITISTERQEIEKNLRIWVSRGRRYRNLCNTIGDTGCLFLLPEAISDYLWENYLPLKGPSLQAAVERLNALGIKEKSEECGANPIARSIEEGLLGAFRWEVDVNQTTQAAHQTLQQFSQTRQGPPPSSHGLISPENCDPSSDMFLSAQSSWPQYIAPNTFLYQDTPNVQMEGCDSSTSNLRLCQCDEELQFSCSTVNRMYGLVPQI